MLQVHSFWGRGRSLLCSYCRPSRPPSTDTRRCDLCSSSNVLLPNACAHCCSPGPPPPPPPPPSLIGPAPLHIQIPDRHCSVLNHFSGIFMKPCHQDCCFQLHLLASSTQDGTKMLSAMSGRWWAWQLHDMCRVASGNRAKTLHLTGGHGCVGVTMIECPARIPILLHGMNEEGAHFSMVLVRCLPSPSEILCQEGAGRAGRAGRAGSQASSTYRA